MIVCPHCGWENPSEAAFCTNCGRGLAKARATRAAFNDDAADARAETLRRVKAAEAGGKTVRDHEMPLLRALAPSVTPPPMPAVVVPPPVPAPEAPEPPAVPEAPVYEPTTGELEAAAPSTEPPVPLSEPVPEPEVVSEPEPEAAPMPRLRAPGPQRDATATLVDFRMPTSFITDLGRAAAAVPPEVPAETTVEPEPEPGPSAPFAIADATPPPVPPASEPPAAESLEGEVIDAEEFPGLAVADDPPSPSDTTRPGEAPTLPRVLTPFPPPLVPTASPVPAPAPSMAEILPLSSLSPSSPLRVARIIEPIVEPTDASEDGDEDIEIPSNPGGDALAEALEPIDERALFGAERRPISAAPAAVDLNALDDVDLDGRIEEVEDVEDISVSDVADLDGPIGDGEVIRSGEMEAVRPEPPRAAPPPLREIDVRFILRPLSNNLADTRLITVGDRGLSIGRSDADVCLGEDAYLSPRHLMLRVEHDTLFGEDQGTLNGTWLRVRSQVELKPGDTFRVGHQLMRLDRAPARGVARDLADGTRRFGADRDATVLCLQQLGDDGLPRNCYFLGEQGARIGRHIADIVFTDDTFMSGTHAVVLPRDDRAVLRDMSSRNGTWVRLSGRQHLVVGDALMLGQTVWRISRPVT
jgi:pSer/pThr/pTyr-binding forkhead associated (FHA) protein